MPVGNDMTSPQPPNQYGKKNRVVLARMSDGEEITVEARQGRVSIAVFAPHQEALMEEILAQLRSINQALEGLLESSGGSRSR